MILGVTGAFGCGKSAVLAAFAAHGWRTADADHLCHELYAEPEGPLARQFAARWGREVLTPEGAVGAEVVQQQMEDGKLDRLRKRLEEIHKEDENDNDTAGVA